MSPFFVSQYLQCLGFNSERFCVAVAFTRIVFLSSFLAVVNSPAPIIASRAVFFFLKKFALLFDVCYLSIFGFKMSSLDEPCNEYSGV